MEHNDLVDHIDQIITYYIKVCHLNLGPYTGTMTVECWYTWYRSRVGVTKSRYVWLRGWFGVPRVGTSFVPGFGSTSVHYGMIV